MTKRNEVYKCALCGNIVTVSHEAGGKLVCCGQEMELMPVKTADQTLEKHVPVIEKTADGIKVTVGSTPHPMMDNHYIEWIEVLKGDVVMRKYLKPGEAPSAEFPMEFSDEIIAREYCNIHGLWANRK